MQRQNSLTSLSTAHSSSSRLPGSETVRDMSTDSLLAMDDRFIKKSRKPDPIGQKAAFCFPNGEVFRPRNAPMRRNRPGKTAPQKLDLEVDVPTSASMVLLTSANSAVSGTGTTYITKSHSFNNLRLKSKQELVHSIRANLLDTPTNININNLQVPHQATSPAPAQHDTFHPRLHSLTNNRYHENSTNIVRLELLIFNPSRETVNRPGSDSNPSSLSNYNLNRSDSNTPQTSVSASEVGADIMLSAASTNDSIVESPSSLNKCSSLESIKEAVSAEFPGDFGATRAMLPVSSNDFPSELAEVATKSTNSTLGPPTITTTYDSTPVASQVSEDTHTTEATESPTEKSSNGTNPYPSREKLTDTDSPSSSAFSSAEDFGDNQPSHPGGDSGSDHNDEESMNAQKSTGDGSQSSMDSSSSDDSGASESAKSVHESQLSTLHPVTTPEDRAVLEEPNLPAILTPVAKHSNGSASVSELPEPTIKLEPSGANSSTKVSPPYRLSFIAQEAVDNGSIFPKSPTDSVPPSPISKDSPLRTVVPSTPTQRFAISSTPPTPIAKDAPFRKPSTAEALNATPPTPIAKDSIESDPPTPISKDTKIVPSPLAETHSPTRLNSLKRTTSLDKPDNSLQNTRINPDLDTAWKKFNISPPDINKPTSRVASYEAKPIRSMLDPVEPSGTKVDNDAPKKPHPGLLARKISTLHLEIETKSPGVVESTQPLTPVVKPSVASAPEPVEPSAKEPEDSNVEDVNDTTLNIGLESVAEAEPIKANPQVDRVIHEQQPTTPLSEFSFAAGEETLRRKASQDANALRASKIYTPGQIDRLLGDDQIEVPPRGDLDISGRSVKVHKRNTSSVSSMGSFGTAPTSRRNPCSPTFKTTPRETADETLTDNAEVVPSQDLPLEPEQKNLVPEQKEPAPELNKFLAALQDALPGKASSAGIPKNPNMLPKDSVLANRYSMLGIVEVDFDKSLPPTPERASNLSESIKTSSPLARKLSTRNSVSAITSQKSDDLKPPAFNLKTDIKKPRQSFKKVFKFLGSDNKKSESKSANEGSARSSRLTSKSLMASLKSGLLGNGSNSSVLKTPQSNNSSHTDIQESQASQSYSLEADTSTTSQTSLVKKTTRKKKFLLNLKLASVSRVEDLPSPVYSVREKPLSSEVIPLPRPQPSPKFDLPTYEVGEDMFDDLLLKFDELEKEAEKEVELSLSKPKSIHDLFLKDDELTQAQIVDQQKKDSQHSDESLPRGFESRNGSSATVEEPYTDENLQEMQRESYIPFEDNLLAVLKTEDFIIELPLQKGERRILIKNNEVRSSYNKGHGLSYPYLKYIRQFIDYELVEIKMKPFDPFERQEITFSEEEKSSILKRNHNRSRAPRNVKFSNTISISETFPPYMYKRYNKSVTQYYLTEFAEINKIKNELNAYKCHEMLVHEKSQMNTHFFY